MSDRNEPWTAWCDEGLVEVEPADRHVTLTYLVPGMMEAQAVPLPMSFNDFMAWLKHLSVEDHVVHCNLELSWCADDDPRRKALQCMCDLRKYTSDENLDRFLSACVSRFDGNAINVMQVLARVFKERTLVDVNKRIHAALKKYPTSKTKKRR